ncbi:MAG: hypothetical protein COC01_01795, partial [Bacteroidetes bacterium]
SNPLTVYPEPIMDFATTAECFSDSAHFFDNSTIAFGSLSIWQWDFGDGTFSYEQNPAHLYSGPGTYTISLKVYSDAGCLDSLSKTLDVQPAPESNFSFTEICFNELTEFTDSSAISSGSIVSWDWFFDDGNSDTTQNSTNLYAQAGVYDVMLVVTSSFDCKDTLVVAVEVHPLPEPNFINAVNCVGQAINFLDSSVIASDSIVDWSWNFGNGFLSGNQNPSTNYSSDGVYTVKLITTSDFGCQDSLEKNITIDPNPVADFNNPDTCLNIISNFIDNSSVTSGIINSWLWKFGDGDTSSTQNPGHLYKSDSSFNVTLVISTNAGCNDTITKAVSIFPIPVAGFAEIESCRNEPVAFVDVSSIASGSIVNWNWDFGNGDTAQGQFPVYLFNGDGDQSVELIVESNFGCKDTFVDDIMIYRPPIAIISGLGDCENDGTEFIDASIETDGNIVKWNWDLGNGYKDTLQEFKYLFDTSGVFTIKLIVESDLGCKDTAQLKLTVNPSPDADFTLSDHIVYVDKIIQLLDASSGPPTSWFWNFGDSLDVDANSENTSILQNPDHWWYYPGVKNVLLVVYNQFGCLDSVIKDVIVKLDPGINTVITPGQGAGGRENTFLNVRGGSYIEFDLKVFNEWGEVIFKTTDPLQGWDGTYKGKFVPNGVYIYQYHVVRDDHQVFDGHGNVTVIR